MTLVIGVGNADRGDDAAGLVAARAVRAADSRIAVAELAGDQLGLLDMWAGADEVIVVDAVWSGAPAGTVFRFSAATPLGGPFRRPGTHTFSLADVIELARNLNVLPPRLTGYGIEGRDFGFGKPLSPPVAAAVGEVAKLLLAGISHRRRLDMCTGITGVIIEVRDDDGMPTAVLRSDETGAVLTASLLTCPEAGAGQTVLVHSGYVLKVWREE